LRRWTQEAEDADPGAPCRRINTVYTMHAIFQEVAVKPDGYGALQSWRCRRRGPALGSPSAAPGHTAASWAPDARPVLRDAGLEVQARGAGPGRRGPCAAGARGAAHVRLPRARRRQARRGQAGVRAPADGRAPVNAMPSSGHKRALLSVQARPRTGTALQLWRTTTSRRLRRRSGGRRSGAR